MSLARIVARSPQASNLVARKLRERGFDIEAHAARVDSATTPDIEFSIEECTIESALEQAGRAGKWVFIAPGALVEGAAIDFALEETNHAVPEAAPESGSFPSIAMVAPVSETATPVREPVTEPLDAPVIFAEETETAEIESETEKEALVASSTATIGDLVTPVEISDLVAVSDPPAEPSQSVEISSQLEMPPVLAATVTSNLDGSAAAVEIPAEESVPPAEIDAVAVEHEDRAISLVQPTAEAPATADFPAPPSPEMLLPASQAAPVAPEKPAAIAEEKLVLPAPVVRPPRRKIRIVLPGFRKNAYLWASAALIFVIGIGGMTVISTKPASHPVNAAQPQTSVAPPQTPQQITNAPAVSSSPTVPAQPASSVTRHHSAASDEGYIAKDTVVRYGASSPTPPKKSTARGRSSQN